GRRATVHPGHRGVPNVVLCLCDAVHEHLGHRATRDQFLEMALATVCFHDYLSLYSGLCRLSNPVLIWKRCNRFWYMWPWPWRQATWRGSMWSPRGYSAKRPAPKAAGRTTVAAAERSDPPSNLLPWVLFFISRPVDELFSLFFDLPL